MRPRILPVSAMLASLAACGGGGGGTPAPTPTPGANAPPVFTSSASASVVENTAGTVLTATATDANGQALTFSISGGADAALFQITAGGALSFRAAPDFELPADAGANNVYDVVLAVSDGIATTTQAVQITVTDAPAGSVVVRRVGTGFSQPLFLTGFPDGSGRVLVVQKGGLIRLLDPATGAIAATAFLDVSALLTTDGERGLLGLALAPDFMTSGRAYVYLTGSGGQVELRRYAATGAGRTTLDPASGDVILTYPHARSNHNGGWIAFGPDGLLYVSTGDGGGGNDPDGNGQNRNTLLGKMLRLDVSRDDFPADANRDYGIPAANPFAAGGGAPEVWLYGLRNAFRNSFDRGTGELWIADVGQDAIEEINRVRITQSGLNMGWPLYEGTRALLGGDTSGLTMPVTQYTHGSGPLQGNSITGGYVYRGPLEALQGLYIFADFISGNIWTAPIGALPQGGTATTSVFTNRNAAFTPDAGTLTNVTSFGEDQGGNVYIVTFGGNVFTFRASS